MNRSKYYWTLILLTIFSFCNAQLQQEPVKWRALFALGVNAISDSGLVSGAEANRPNLATINIGVQHMLKPQYGVRLDYGFNRFKNTDNSPEFKINYIRINTQFVYDLSQWIGLNYKTALFAHIGPGYSFTRALGGLNDVDQNYLNLMGGIEWHYAISRKISLFMNVSYLHGFTSLDNYTPALSGLGAFNGNVAALTFGVSLTLSDCYTCN